MTIFAAIWLHLGVATAEEVQPPIVTSHPEDVIVAEGGQASFSVVADYSADEYEWQQETSPGVWTQVQASATVSGTHDATLIIDPVTLDLSGTRYRVRVIGDYGTDAYSNPATLTVTPAQTTVSITTQPVDKSMDANATGEIFSVVASNATSYQWQVSADAGASWEDIQGAAAFTGSTTDTLSVIFAFSTMDGFKFRVIVGGEGGPVTSSAATLTVNQSPATVSITTQPVDKSLNANTGGQIFSVGAANATGYEWQLSMDDGQNWITPSDAGYYSGVYSATLTTGAVTVGMDGRKFRVIVSGHGGPITSNVVTLTVIPPPTLTISPAPNELANGRVGHPYIVAFSGGNGVAPYYYELESEDMPLEMSFDEETGTLSGTPTETGTYHFTLHVWDDNAVWKAFDYTWVVLEEDDPEAYDPAAVARDIDARARGFVRTRQGLITMTAGVPGLIDRRHGGQSPGPRASASSSGFVFGYAASTASAQAEAARQLAEGVPSAEAVAPFNIWIDGTLALTTGDNGANWGSFAMVSVGADYLVSDKVLVGLSLHLDNMTDPADGVQLEGTGWLAGPYASVELGEGVFWDSQLLYGGSRNSVEDGDWSGSFDTRRWLVDTSLKGRWQLDEATVLTPRLRALYLAETADGYVVDNGMGGTVDVPGFSEEQLRMSLNADIERRFSLENGITLTPRLGGAVGYAGLGGAGLFGTASTGFSLDAGDAWSLDAGFSINVEGDGQKSATTRVGVSGRF